MFIQACVRPDFELAADLQDWHAAVNKLLLAEFGLELAPQRYQRTKNRANAKPNRWAKCVAPTLRPIGGVGTPTLNLRPRSARHESRAAIDVPNPAADLAEFLTEAATARGFNCRPLSSGTLIVEKLVPEAVDWSVSMPLEHQIPYLLAVGQAGVELRDWWNALSAPSSRFDQLGAVQCSFRQEAPRVGPAG